MKQNFDTNFHFASFVSSPLMPGYSIAPCVVHPAKHDFSNFTNSCKIFLQIGMCKMSYKFVKNESYLIFRNICKPHLAYFTSILQKIGSK
jgi:hypothetical protein